MKLMPATRFGVVWRGLVAFVVVVGCAAGATATAGLLQLKQVADDFSKVAALKGVNVKLPPPGAPETLFLVGVDHRYGQGDGIGNTDTMMLVRINDNSSTINLLSVPRDLEVSIPGVGLSKLNAAYADGGPNLLLRVLRQQVFPGLQVSHILVIDFAGFAKLINEIGCVYADVDHRYYNYNDGTIGTDFSNIDIQPGYQKLCGGSGSNLGGANTALAFVRFRHNDSDIVRESRQQDFLRWAKQDFSTGQLVSDEQTLLSTFAANVQTDGSLQKLDGIDELFGLAINADGSTIKSIPFPYGASVLVGGADDLSFSEAASAHAYREFSTPTVTPTTTTTTSTTTPAKSGKSGKSGRKRRGRRHAPAPPTVPAGLRADPGDGRSQAGQLGRPGLPVYYPDYVPDYYEYCFAITGDCSEGYAASVYAKSYPRRYKIDGDDGKKHAAYVMTLVYGTPGTQGDLGTGDYFTVQGTTWQFPPILRHPSAVKRVRGKLLAEYSQGGKFAVVAWHTKKGVYWIANTLQNTIPNAQMVSIAASFTRAP
jgi:polyisoprenyl-teichoic acid--peptidoglycan teichoic acid transferase